MKKATHPLSTNQPSKASLAQIRKLAAQLLIRDGRPVVRNLDFYQKAEKELLANHSPYGSGGMRLSPCWAER